jgi:HEAT repeat protein
VSASTFEACLKRFRSTDPTIRRESAEALATLDQSQAVNPLIEGLRDENPGVQEAVVAALIRIGGPRVVSSLVPLLREDVGTRNLALEVLEQTGSAGLDILLPLLSHDDANIRKFIVDILGKLGDHRAIPPLIAVLQDREPNVRGAAAEGLGYLRAREAVPQLLGLLDDNEWVVFTVIEALGYIADPAALPALMVLLKDGSETVRYVVIEALGKFSDSAACVKPMLDLMPSADRGLRDLLTKNIITLAGTNGLDLQSMVNPDWFVLVLEDAVQADQEDVVMAGIRGFEMIESSAGTVAILGSLEGVSTRFQARADEIFEQAGRALLRCADGSALMAALTSPVERVVSLAAETLGKLRVREAVQPLAQLILRHGDRDVRRQALKALGRIGDPMAIRFVISALEDENGHVRAAAATVLGKWINQSGIEPLCGRLLVEPFADVRVAIVDALCANPHPLISEVLMGLLLNHEREEVREAAARGLGRLRPPAALRPLLDVASDPSWLVRAAIIQAIGRYPVRAAFEALRLALTDDHEKVRLASLLALTVRQEPEIEEILLVQGLGDSDLWVRYRAAEALGVRRAEAALPALALIAKSDREPSFLRRMAVEALGQVGDPRAGETLSELMWDHNPDVSAAAAQALDALQGGGEGDDPWK